MNRNSTVSPQISLDRTGTTPLHHQIYYRIKNAITQGILPPNGRIPSARSLASELNVARGTVDTAYERLYGEGFLIARGQAGTFVAPAIGNHATPSASTVKRPARPQTKFAVPGLPSLIFNPCIPAFDVFPRKLWAKLGARRLRAISAAELAQPDPLGYMPLRQAIASYLQISRGISCSPDQIFVTSAYQGGLDLISRTLLKHGDQVWMEDPGYRAARNLFIAAGSEIIPVPVDSEGIQVDTGVALAPHARLAVVTPSHQSPTGVPLSLARRFELLDWANKAEAWIIEDDYDGEYRYTGHPLPALKSLDRHDRVLYAGTFSKVLCPSLRLGYLVVPSAKITHFESAAKIFHTGCSPLTQGIVHDFMIEGHFSRHLKKMRALYAKRRKMVIDALNKIFGNTIDIELQTSGMHLLIRTRWDIPDKEIASRLRAHGFGIHALSDWAIAANQQGLLIGFTNVDSIASAENHAQKMKTVLFKP